ncbi:hypothetical protein A7A78_08995 [Aequorivita soesokkakensis]|uniref:Selenophosphate synthetase n=1 Tax=Aequorivita soesokkakensis TaxID=1385699 RepID=A0A1A9LGJ0_9FLAO|nr:hypothetical protein [Aequorivita soesokkakensis]OAD92217.1 hypothetical protein A7A78_08995 [Aequorivita soesokkakensis]
MKKSISLVFISFALISCNNTKNSSGKNEEKQVISEENLSTAEKIADANGFKNWKDVSEIAFTFNADRGENHFERSWIWKPKTDDVSLISSEGITINHNRSSMDSLTMQTDAKFINDKYWLLAPFQIAWDEGTTFSEKEKVLAPISKDTLNQLTIVYGNVGGYTPGDAYDFFYDKNYKIKEWNFRQGNSEAVSMSTTWEDYENFNGLEIAKTHKDSTGNFKLYFTNISVKN